MNFLLLGATGSVGRQVVDQLLTSGHRVYGVARKRALHWNDDAELLELDLTAMRSGELLRVIDRHEIMAILNASGGPGYTKEAMKYSHSDLIDKLLKELQGLPHPMRFVHFGTVHEYGEATDGQSFCEEDESRPISEYAQVKASVSHAVLQSDAIEPVVLRCVNMFGPFPPQESFLAALLPRIVNALRSSELLEIPVADAVRDYVDVREAARASILAATADQCPRIINVGRGEALPMRELVELLIEVSGIPEELVDVVTQPVLSKGGMYTCLDITRAKQCLEWEPAIDPRESIADMWACHQGHAGLRGTEPGGPGDVADTHYP